jgi:Fur family ferric uptake transcriptional regulator
MRSAAADDLLDRLRHVGLRATTQRRVIVEALLAHPAHVTAEGLATEVRVQYPEVHSATVYRTLEVLESLGVLYRLDNGHAPTQWHLSEGSHQHLVCDSCGQVEEVSNPAFARLAVAIQKDYGFNVDLRHTAIRGLCRRCCASPTEQEASPPSTRRSLGPSPAPDQR